MSKKEQREKLNNIREIHIRIEKLLQTAAMKASSNVCSGCNDICCKLRFCKESVDSRFLRFILGDKAALFDKNNGWLVPQCGCSTPYGRPLICYEFFCFRFKNDPSVDALKNFSRTFKKIYQKASGNQHILVLKDLTSISPSRLDKILKDLNDLEHNALNAFGLN